jgi:hypothetical protein
LGSHWRRRVHRPAAARGPNCRERAARSRRRSGRSRTLRSTPVFSTFTHTDVDDFAGLAAEARRLLRRGGRFVYVGNHPCFVGPVQEHTTALPVLHPGYRRGGRWDAAEAPGSTPDGWRTRLGSYVHLPLAEFLNAFAGLTLVSADEGNEEREYPTMIARHRRHAQPRALRAEQARHTQAESSH